MVDHEAVERGWFIEIATDEARLRCFYRRRGKRIFQYTVQLEVYRNDIWMAVVRYDNAHGFGHCDTLHADGTQEKTPIYFGDENATFTKAIGELLSTWETHRDRFLRELKDD